MSYAKTDFGPFPAGIGKQSAIELFQYVRTGTDASAVLIFRKPKAMGLFGERRTAAYPQAGTDSELWQYIASIHASYLVEGPIDDPIWHAFIQRNENRLSVAYSNSEFKVYRTSAETAH